MSKFVGFAQLDMAFEVCVLVRSGNTPVNADALPTFRVYGPAGVMNNGTGTVSFKDTGSISGATNAAPIVVTSTAHKLSTGARVTITGAVGNTAANGTFVVTRIDADTFSLQGSTGNGVWTSGGTWNVTGLYKASLSMASSDGYEIGTSYVVLFVTAVSAAAWADMMGFVAT